MAPPPAPLVPDLLRSTDVLHDDDYYYSTGDTVIRIENTLFKVHKLFLTYNSAVFATMFDLPGVIGRAEGLSDDLPIVLNGETAENFRIIMKYVYARPSQIQIANVYIDALAEIVSLVQSAHKYEMDDWVDWGLQVLTRLLRDLNSLPVEHLRALHSLYNLLEDIAERSRMMTHWCEVVERDNLPILPILDAAERCGDEDAMAEAYCIQIRRWEKKAAVIEPQSFSADGLSQDHIQRILSGYASLSLSWSQLHSHGTSFPLPNARFQLHATEPRLQAHGNSCIQHSRRRWAQAVVDADSRYPHITQFVNRLRHAVQYLQESGPKPDPWRLRGGEQSEDCLQNVIKRVNLDIQNDVHLLASHFFPKSHVA
ncbi:hypothetical protein GGX14DRAFT_588273 [Mycena pura]|uniref:BTB domain-containing protein n=1 Tax=Mycena pura TaxID=153505 RepID=A0AAD6UWL7_9AGAR|nr:hypothetical protein GGX14DRAFT_588273 [Mycena pura]